MRTFILFAVILANGLFSSAALMQRDSDTNDLNERFAAPLDTTFPTPAPSPLNKRSKIGHLASKAGHHLSSIKAKHGLHGKSSSKHGKGHSTAMPPLPTDDPLDDPSLDDPSLDDPSLADDSADPDADLTDPDADPADADAALDDTADADI